jgi:hypothetical protein
MILQLAFLSGSGLIGRAGEEPRMENSRMICVSGFAKQALVSSFLLGSCVSAAVAQEQAGSTDTPVVFLETFETGDPMAMLGGQIDLGGDSQPWILHVTDGKLVLENRTAAQNIHYNDIGFVKYPDSSSLESTETSVISAVVESRNEGSGGVGIFFGSGDAGAYLAFLVDAQGQYHVMRKQGKKVSRLHSGTSDAILADKPNAVSLAWRGADLAFFANGTEVIKVPYAHTPGSGQGGLGLAAFGIGAYLIDSVEFSRAN